MITMFTKKTKGNILLGRWSTISNEKSKINYKKFKQNIDFNIDSANHDHCGSELCNKIKNKKNIYTVFKDEEMFPYLL